MRKVMIGILLCAEVSYLVTFVLYLHTLSLLRQEIGERLKAVAATAASEFNARDLNQLHWAKDMKTEAYQRVFRKLHEIRSNNAIVTYAYIMKMNNTHNYWEFVADADSNYNVPELGLDYNRDGLLTEADENVAAGVVYV